MLRIRSIDVLRGFAALALLELMLVVWEHHSARYSLEWILASLTAVVVRPRSPEGRRL